VEIFKNTALNQLNARSRSKIKEAEKALKRTVSQDEAMKYETHGHT